MTTILVVEDEAVVAADIAQRLKRSGYDVPAVAATGEAALRMTEALHPDLILMDILLKGEKDGIETAREIDDQFEIPIIFLTGQADESTLARVRDTSHYGFLLKPIDTAALFPTVEMALTRHAFAVQLKESESRFRAVTDSAVEAILSMDMQGNVTYWNKAAERTFGWTADEITGQSVAAIIPESAKAGFFRMLPELGTRETYVPPSFTLWRRKDGTEFPAEPSFASWKTKEGTFATAIVHDISEQKAIIESVKAGIVLVDPITHKIADINTTGAHLFGASKDAIIGSVCHRFICPAEVGRCPITDLGQTVDNAERVLLTADGKSRPILKSVSRITLRGHAYLLESFIDISDRKQMELALLESEAYYRAIFESTATGMAIVEEDMTVAMVNGILEQLTGFSKNEVEGLKPWTDFVAPEDLELMETYHRTRRRDEGSAPKGYEFRLLTKDGTRREAFLTVALIPGTRRSVVSIVDLTALKTAQEAVRKQAGMLDAAHDAIMTLDPEGTITYWNRGAERLYGWTKQEAGGQNANALLRTRFPESREALWPKLMESGLWEGELIHVTRDGIPITVASSWTLMKDERGNASAILEISSDITERKKAELALADSEAKLRITFASMTDGIVLNGLDRKVTDCNEAVLRLTQRSREEIIGKPFTDLLAPEFRSQILETIPELLEKGAIRTNSKMLRKNGESFDVESNVSLIKDAAGQPTAFLTVIRDVTERKKAESVLQEAQEELRQRAAMLDAAHDCIVIFDDVGTLTYWNRGAERLYGWTKQEAEGQNVHVLLKTTFPESREVMWPKLMESGLWAGELRNVTRDGVPVTVASSWTLLKDEKGDNAAVLEISSDITELTRAEDELRKSEQKHRHFLDALQEGVWVIDKDSNVTFTNPRMAEMLGYTVEEMSGKHLFSFMDERGVELAKYLLERRQRGIREEHDFEFMRKDGSRIYTQLETTPLFNDAGEYDGAIAAVSNVTEKRQAENALQQSHEDVHALNEELQSVNDELRTMNETLEERVQERTERLRVTSLYARSLIEASLDPLVTISTEGKITDVNAATEEVTGCTRDELIGSDFSDFFTEPAKANAGYQRVFNEGSIRDYPLAIRHRSGEVSDVLYNATVFRNDAGEIQGVFASARDISALKQLEQVLRESKLLEKRTAELARSNAELEQFAYIASHDLQEPLRMITSYLQIIEEDYKGKLDEDADEYIGFAVDGAKRMQTLINDLLKYSRVGTKGKSFVPISTETTLSEALDNMKVTIDETKAVITHDQLPTVLGDDAQLTQVFQNLLSNAIKFRGNSAPQIHVGVEQTPKEWVFSVRDNGIGIDMKYAERIFTIFQRLHARGEYPGTGIGLAVVKKIVERHGGRIWVESAPESGSTFYFTLPTTGGSVRYEQTK